MGAINGAVLFKKYTGILSGPLALWDWRLDSWQQTSSIEIEIDGMSGKGAPSAPRAAYRRCSYLHL